MNPVMVMAYKPASERIMDHGAAWRCVRSIQEYLRQHESPLAAEDLDYAVTFLVNAAQRG